MIQYAAQGGTLRLMGPLNSMLQGFFVIITSATLNAPQTRPTKMNASLFTRNTIVIRLFLLLGHIRLF
jgi:hypothetical protein